MNISGQLVGKSGAGFLMRFFYKPTVIALVFLFFILPLNPAMAEVVLPSSSANSQTPETKSTKTEESTDLVNSSNGFVNEANKNIVTTQNVETNLLVEAQNQNAPSENDIVPSGSQGADINLKQVLPEADPATGALVHRFPIIVPAGRSGLQPELNLQYNSQNTEKDSSLGYGWSLNIPYIQRTNKKGTNNIYNTNYFTSSLSGELATTSSATDYVPQTESGEFLKYSFSANSWTVVDKQGKIYTFGSQTAARQDNPNDSSQIYKWMLEKIQDTNGNFISYTYYKDGGQVYPQSIFYTGNGANSGIFEVDFLRASRADVVKSYAPAFLVTTNYLINEIDVKVSGSWVTKYQLAYVTGDNGVRSLLSTITQSGRDASNNITALPPVSFSYTHSSPGFTYAEKDINYIPIDMHYGVLPADVNGDAYPDLVQAYEWTTANYYAFKNLYLYHPQTDNWQQSTSSLPGNIVIYSNDAFNPHDGGSKVLDINGDLKADLLRNNGGFNNEPNDAEINNGANWWDYQPNWVPPYKGYTTTDINGDGLPDYIQTQNPRGSAATGYYDTVVALNNTKGFDEHANIGDQANSPTNNFSSPEYLNQHVFADINGDGLPDILKSTFVYAVPYSTTTQAVYLNNGGGWSLDNGFTIPNDITFYNTLTQGFLKAYFEDMNRDGLIDIMIPFVININNSPITNLLVYINRGSYWSSDPAWYSLANIGGIGGGNYQNPVLIFDMDGDGSQDIMSNSISGTNHYESTVYFNNTHTQSDILSSITLPQGGKITAVYKPSAQYKDGSGNLLNPNLPLNIETVSAIGVSDGVGPTATTTYSYLKGSYYFNSNDVLNRKFAGFAEIDKTDPAGNVTKTFYHTGTGTDSAHGEYQDNYYKIGKPYRSEVYDSAGHLFSKTINKWDSVSLSPSAAFVKLSQTLESSYDGTATHKDKAESYAYNNSNGNITQKVEYGQVNGDDDGSFVDTGSDKLTTSISYASSVGSSVIGSPSDVTVVDQSSNKVKQSRFYYDGLALGSIGAGNQTKEEAWIVGSSYVNTQKTYNSYGLVTQSLDANGNPTNYVYDTFNLYPATVTNALNQATQYTYNYQNGKPV